MIVLPGRLVEDGRVQVRLRGLDRHLLRRHRGELGEERVAGRPLVDDRRVAEADVDGGRSGHAVEGPRQRGDAVLPGLLGTGLHVRLVDLDHVGAGREEIDGSPR